MELKNIIKNNAKQIKQGAAILLIAGASYAAGSYTKKTPQMTLTEITQTYIKTISETERTRPEEIKQNQLNLAIAGSYTMHALDEQHKYSIIKNNIPKLDQGYQIQIIKQTLPKTITNTENELGKNMLIHEYNESLKDTSYALEEKTTPIYQRIQEKVIKLFK
ncbi:MAG: hypothetical protein ACLFN8_04605 [Candidatus Woesearchaeota archaeon]